MVLQSNQERVKALLKDTITLLCKNGLDFKNKFNIEALIGVTVDDSDVFLISMNEVVKLDAAGTPSAAVDDETDPAQSSVVPTPDLSLPQAQSKGNFQQRNQKQVEIKHEPINPLSDHAYLNISNIQTEVSVHEHGTSQAKRRRTDFETSNVVEIKPSQNSKNQQIVFVKEEVVDSPALDQQSVTTDSPNVVYSMKDSLEDSVWSQSVLGPEPGESLQSTAEVIPSSNSQSDPQPGSSGQSDPQPGSSEQSRLHPQPESSLSSVKQPQTMDVTYQVVEGSIPDMSSVATIGGVELGGSCVVEVINLPEDPGKSTSDSNKILSENAIKVVAVDGTSKRTLLKCLWCSYATVRKTHMVRHLHRHVGQKKCQVCGEVFPNQLELQQHRRAEHPRHACDKCDKWYQSRMALWSHNQRAHNSKPLRHVCKICGDSFQMIAQYRAHLYKHDNVRPYSCGKCQNTYLYKSDLLRHVKKCQCTEVTGTEHVEVAGTEVGGTEVGGTEVTDTEVAGIEHVEVAGTEVAGIEHVEVARTEVAGIEHVEVARTEVAGIEVTGTEVTDTEVTDTEVTGIDTPS